MALELCFWSWTESRAKKSHGFEIRGWTGQVGADSPCFIIGDVKV